MTLQHSKTWPVNTVAIVQLRVDSNGRAYSSFMGQEVNLTSPQPCRSFQGNNPKSPKPETTSSNAGSRNTSVCDDDDDDDILPMFKQHLQIFGTMYKPVRTDTVSTIVEQELEIENEVQNCNGERSIEIDTINHPLEETIRPYDKIQVLALARIEEVSDESDTRASFRRRPSIKIDNWDLLYTENNKSHCQKHPNNDTTNVNANAANTCDCKSKNVGRCNEHTDCLLPEIPLDARKVTTLRRHYYPEGGWGWVIVVCSVLVHVLNNGLQLSCSQLVLPAAGKFKTLPVHVAAARQIRVYSSHKKGFVLPTGYPDKRVDKTRVYLVAAKQGSGVDEPHVSRTDRLVADLRQLLTLKQHYYPEGGWGWIVLVVGVLVHILSHGLLVSYGFFYLETVKRFGTPITQTAGWLGAVSTGVALLISPVTIAFCRRKSTRVTAVMGGLITALGCLFTSFATQFHQLFFSYGTVVGIGVGITRDCSTLMVAQYFKRRREFVEIFIVSGSGLGIAVMSIIIKTTVGTLGWRLGLQVVTGAVSITFILGTFYRSASLYHPQRRAILHIKNQKRKIKDKNKIEDKIPFFDFSTLKSKTVRILLISTGISAFGINTPLFYLAYQAEVEGLGDSTVFLQMYLGLAWTLGCVVFSTLVLHNSTECRIARQYLCQTAVFMCGLSILAFTVVSGNYHAYVMFAWIYGIFCGGYHYSLKMYTYERVRARNFARTWGFVQCSQAIPIVIGVPFSGYMNEKCGDRAGYYFSSTCVLVGSLTLFLIDLHRRNISRHKHTRENGTRHLCVSDTCPQRRKLSFSQEPDHEPGVAAGAAAAALVLGTDLMANQQVGFIENIICSNDKPELTCISEEGIADMDLPDNLLDDLDYIGDCITSCNKVENYLMLSEFENNLIAEMPVILDRKGRRWSLARPSKVNQGSLEENTNNDSGEEATNGIGKNNTKWKVFPNRVITVIDESSV